MGDMQYDNGGAAEEEQEVVAMRNEALSLLKSKMRRSRRALRSKHLPQEQHVADKMVEDGPETDHQDGNEADETPTPQMEVHERVTGLPDDSPALQSICIVRSKCSKTVLRDIVSKHGCLSDNQREEQEQEEEQELTIAQLKQKTVVVVEGSSRRRPEPNAHTKAPPSAIPRPPSTKSTASCAGLTMVDTRASTDSECLSTKLQQQEQHDDAKNLTKLVVKWSCRTCNQECIPIREESRCLCGHRYKEHPPTSSDPRVKNKAAFRAFACTSAKCACKSFFYVVAEGAWILRCRCKHKHIDHDPSAKPYHCTKPTCSCSGFDSPWICNCNHPWAEHTQETVEKQFKPLLARFQEQFQVEELNCVQRTDLFAEPFVQS